MVVPQWLVDFSAHPQLVQQYGQLPSHGNDGSFLGKSTASELLLFSIGHQHSQGSVCKIPELGENATRCTMPTYCGDPSMCENGQGILKRVGWQKGSMFEEVCCIPGKEAAAE